jgi:hypothetical protein
VSKVSYTLVGLKGSIHLSFDGTFVTLANDHRLYSEVRELIKQKRQDEIPALLLAKSPSLEEYVEGKGLYLVDGRLQDTEGHELPPILSQRLQELNEEGFEVDGLVAFWENLKQNPSLNSREQLYKFLEQNGHPLTDDGHFIAYRGVSADFRDLHTNTFDNSPGSVCKMPRKDVDDNPNRTCSRGLHVAAFDYASTFGPVTMEVKVNPRDVVAVPTDYNGQKMRVCEFVVVRQCPAPNLNAGYKLPSDTTWDSYEEDGLDMEIVDEILQLADFYKDRYKDRASLAARIDEDVDYLDVDTVTILQVLNDHFDD